MSKLPLIPHQTTYPLSKDEQACFGWPDNGLVVCSVRGPDGKRVIPTRQLTACGAVFYGEVSTSEPPPGVSDEDWDAHFNSFESGEVLYALS